VGDPSRVSREGKTGPSEAGRGKYSPPANPERVTAGASERRNGGVLLQRSKKERLSRNYGNNGLKILKLWFFYRLRRVRNLQRDGKGILYLK